MALIDDLKKLSLSDLLTEILDANGDVRSDILAERIIDALTQCGWQISKTV